MNGEALRKLRTDRDMSIVNVVQATGLSPEAIRRLELGIETNPKLDTLRKLADAYGVRVADLIGEEAA